MIVDDVMRKRGSKKWLATYSAPYASYTRDRRKQDDSTTYDAREDVDEDIQYLSDIDYFQDETDELEASK